MIFGYARVSTEEQSLNRQIDQLQECGVEKIFEEKMTGTKKDRPQLNKMLEQLREGDTVIITDLTRISRSTMDLLSIVEQIKDRGASIRSIKDTWLDTTSDNPYNSFLLTVMSGLSQLERDLISQRTKEGLKSARARGKVGGRPKKDKKAIERALMIYDDGRMSVSEICELCGISKNTLYNYIRARKKVKEEKKS